MNTLQKIGKTLKIMIFFMVFFMFTGKAFAQEEIPPTGITLSLNVLKMPRGDFRMLFATVSPEDATDKTVTWTSADESIASVVNGFVTAKALGTTLITASTSNNLTATCKVIVENTDPWAKAGEDTVAEGGTVKISLGDAYKRTLEKSTDITYEWFSENDSYATVTSSTEYDAIVKGMKAGTSCKIYYQCSYKIDGFDRTMNFYYTVTVTEAKAEEEKKEPTGITLNPEVLNMHKGETMRVSAVITPENATDKTIRWTIADEDIASVDNNGNVTAKAVGTTELTAFTSNNLSATCQVVVTNPEIEPSGITLNFDAFYMLKGEIRKLTATVLPEDATDKSVRWTIGDESVAMVDSNGVVFAMGWGTTEVTAYTSNNLSATCQIVVARSMVEPTGITLNHDVLNMLNGETVTLTATIAPENATDKTVRWTIADEGIATVDKNGSVTAKAVGTTELTAYTSNNLSATCKIVVSMSNTEVETNWEGHYKVYSSNVVLDKNREYPDVFDMDIEKVGDDWYVTSMFGEDLTQFNDGGFKLYDNGDGSASVDIMNDGILEYTNESNPLYAIYVFDENTDDWKDTWEFKMNDDGTISIENFYIAAFTWSEENKAWENGNLMAYYYDVKAKTGSAIDRLDLYFSGSMTGWGYSEEWKFLPYEDLKDVYYFPCPEGKDIVSSDMFLIQTKDWSLVYGLPSGYGLTTGEFGMPLDELTQLSDANDSWTISLSKRWNGICWLDIETGTVIFSNDPNYVAPFATSAVVSTYEADADNEEYYDLKGNRIDKEHLGSGIYIVRKGSHSKKIMVK